MERMQQPYTITPAELTFAVERWARQFAAAVPSKASLSSQGHRFVQLLSGDYPIRVIVPLGGQAVKTMVLGVSAAAGSIDYLGSRFRPFGIVRCDTSPPTSSYDARSRDSAAAGNFRGTNRSEG